MSTPNKENTLSHNHIAQDVCFDGEIEFGETLIISGLVSGSLSSPKGHVHIDEKGVFSGKLVIHSLQNKGEIAGEVFCDSVSVYKSSIAQANITTKEITVEKGAYISGTLTMPKPLPIHE